MRTQDINLRIVSHPRVVVAVFVATCALIFGGVTACAAVAATYKIELTGSGTVVSSPSGLSCSDISGPPSGECSSEFAFFTAVELTASPGPGSQFEGWSGTMEGGSCDSGATNPCSFTVFALPSGNYTITADFGSTGPQQPLEVKRTGAGGGEVKSSPSGIECGTKCDAEFSEGSTVVLTASPNERSTFAAWKGCTSVNVEDKCEVTMSEAKFVEAEFDAIPQQTLEVRKTGSGSGEVTSSPLGIECGATCTNHFNEGATVVLTATLGAPTPGARYTFGGWTGCSNVTAEDKCEVTMSAAKTVEAKFDAIPEQTLKVDKAGSGFGEVTSSPAGISCGGSCEAEFDEGATVTLTATPSSESVFAGWSGGGCTGTAPCQVTLAAATTVTASFEPVPPPTASTGEATELTQTTATLSGIVDGQGFDTHYLFDYGETTSFGSQAPPNNGIGADAGVVAADTAETEDVSGLTPNTTYHYKIVAYNIPCSFFCPRSGPNTTFGEAKEFTTQALPPVALAAPPANISPTGATLIGSFNPQGVAGTYHFEYGTTTNYGTSSPDTAAAAANTGVVVSADTAGLEPNTTYHYRLVTANNGGATIADSADETFTTYATGAPNTAPSTGFSLTGTAPAGAAAMTFPDLTGFAPMPPAKESTTPKTLTNAQKLAAALKACKKANKSKKKQAACEKQARSKYGPVKKRKKK
ncbi:MAG TPA: hypothetical protein VII53_02315 [Solirubrobacteraceae bacterium]